MPSDPYSQKELLAIKNEELLLGFKLSTGDSYDECVPAILPNRLFAKHFNKYKKDTCKVGEHQIDFLKKNGFFHSLLWHTTPENVYQSVRFGIYKPQALTAQIIAVLGTYRLKSLERAYEDGIISNRYEEKEQLVSITQDRIEALQTLECLTNSYDPKFSLQENTERINQVFSSYISQLDERKQAISHEIRKLEAYDSKASNKIIKFIEADIQSAKVYQARLENSVSNGTMTETSICTNILGSTSPYSISSWINKRIVSAIKQGQEINQNLTYGTAKTKENTRALLRGDLNSVFEDALKAANDYRPDCHNQILPEHQGRFSLEKGKEVLTLDFNFNQQDPEANRQALMAISHIEKVDSIERFESDRGKYHLVSKDKEKDKEVNYFIALKETPYTKWDKKDLEKQEFIIRFLKGTCNIVTGIVFGLTFDLVWGLIGGIGHSLLQVFSNKPKDHWGYRFFAFSLAEKVKIETEAGKFYTKHYAESLKHLQHPKLPFGRKLGQKLANLASNTIWELLKGIITLVKNFKIELFDNLSDDWYFSHAIRSENETLKKELRDEMSNLDDMLKFAHNGLGSNYEEKYRENYARESYQQVDYGPKKFPGEKYREAAEKYQECLTKNRQFALPPYLLKSPLYTDPLNGLVRGTTSFLTTFSHHVHVKHPFTGLLFTLSYVSGGLSILAPKLAISILGKNYVAFSQGLGQALAHGKVSSAIASSFTQAKLASAIFEATIHGRKSWLSKGTSLLEKEPADILIYTTLAVGLGTLIAYKLSIPWLSEHIREDLGTFPIPTLGFAGGKIIILLVELLEKRKHVKSFNQANWDIRFREEIETYYREGNSIDIDAELDATQLEEIESISELLLNKENCEKMDQAVKAQRRTLAITDQEKEKINEDMRPVLFLKNCLDQSDLLPKLDHRSKRKMLYLIKKEFPNQPALLIAIKNLLYPEKTYSILQTTLLVIFMYVPLLIRCVATILTWSPEPWRDLGNKIRLDLSRVAHALKGLATLLAYGVGVMVKSLGDIIFNEIGARVEAWIRRDKHSLSSFNYAISDKISSTSCAIGEHLSRPVDALERAVTSPDPKTTLGNYTFKLFPKTTEGCFDKSERNSIQRDSRSSLSL